MNLYNPIEIDLYKPYPLPIMEAQQNNVGRGAIVTLKANGAIIEPTDEYLTFYAKRPGGNVSYLAATLDGTKIKIDFTNQMLSTPGLVQVEIRMTAGKDASKTDISTPIFAVKVNESNIDDDATESSNEFTALVNALAEIEELKKTGLKGDKGDKGDTGATGGLMTVEQNDQWIEQASKKMMIGTLLNNSATVKSVYGKYVSGAPISLQKGYRYFVSANVASSIGRDASQLARITVASGTPSARISTSGRSTMSNGGGVNVWSVVETANEEVTIAVESYGYYNGEYDHIFTIVAICLGAID